MKNHSIINFFFVSLLCLFTACEEEFIPEITTDPQDIVVEGYIESGDLDVPPYILLTRSLPFFSVLDFGDLDGLFVHDAIVTIEVDNVVTTLEEICWNDFDPAQQEVLLAILAQSGIGSIDTIPGNFCVYIDPTLSILGEAGKTYDLRIEVEDKILTASTSIPEEVRLDSLYFIDPAGNPPDSLLELRVFVDDPAGEMNFYRYFTSINFGGFIPGFNSIAEDNFFNGQYFEFPLPKGEPRTDPGDPETFGLYTVGDTVTIKWTTIDQASFNFWNTLEFNSVNQGPFSSYTRVDSNIENGLGIWCGYNSS